METNNALALSSPATLATFNGETASTALATQAEAEIKAALVWAERHPRDLDDVRARILKDCSRPAFAASAIYHKPIGKGVEGPSIRFVEAALSHMGNVRPQCATVFDDPERRIVRVTVADIERNVQYGQDVTVTKTVERRNLQRGETALRTRVGAGGQLLYILPASDDDILNKQNALISKAIRTLGLRIIPPDIIDEALETVRETQSAKDAQDPDTARRRLFDAFARECGVSVAQIKDYLGHEAAMLNPAELRELRGLYAALKDGETNWREVMDAKHPRKDADTPAQPSTLKAALRSRRDTDTTMIPNQQTGSETNAEGK